MPHSPVFHVKHVADAPAGARHRARWAFVLGLLGLLAVLTTACERVAAPEGWAAPLNQGSEYYAQLDKGVLWQFQIDGTNVKRGWRYPAADAKSKFDAIYATPILQDGVIYVAAHKGQVVALDVTSGQPLPAWGGAPVDLKQDIVATPVLAGKRLILATENGDLYSINTANGQATRLLKGDGRIWSGLARNGSTVFLGNLDDRRVRAVNIDSGDIEWAQSIAGASIANLVLDDRLLLVGSLDRSLHALDVNANGTQAWSFTGDGWFAAQSTFDSGAIYAATLKGSVYALDPSNGSQRWSLHRDGESFRSRPVVIGHTLVITSRDGTIFGINTADGSELWHHALLNQHVDADPLVVGSDVIIITTSGQLDRVNAATGDTQTLGAAS